MSDLDVHNKVSETNDKNGNIHQEKPRQSWVKFDEESGHTNIPLGESQTRGAANTVPSTSDCSTIQSPAVLKTETVHVNLERGDRIPETVTQLNLSRNSEIVNVRQGFCK